MRASLKEKANIHGKMALFIQENLRTDLNMGKENGKVGKGLIAITMKVIIVMIKSQDMEYFNGQAGIFIKENIRMMKEMAMEK